MRHGVVSAMLEALRYAARYGFDAVPQNRNAHSCVEVKLHDETAVDMNTEVTD